MIVEATPLKVRFKVSASHGSDTGSTSVRNSLFCRMEVSRVPVVVYDAGTPMVKSISSGRGIATSVLRMFNMFHGCSFKSRGCSVQHVKYHCHLHTELVTLLS